jgi:trehalose 6-phosphate phosphatase
VLDVAREHVVQHGAELEASGVSLEDKLHSMALHYRLARDRPAALDVISRVVSGLSPDVRVFGGKMVINIVAVRAPDKGDAVMDLMARSGTNCAVFAGDDLNDEPVFERADGSWLTVKVGRDDPTTRAMFVLDSFGEVATMLDRMITALEGSSTRNGP